MKSAHGGAETPKSLRLHISRHVPSSIAGPGLSALRECYDVSADPEVTLAPVFERIGGHLDAAVSRPDLNRVFAPGVKQIVVGISDATWRSTVVLAVYTEHDIRPVSLGADAALNAVAATCREAGAEHGPSDLIGFAWAAWSRGARKNLRSGRAFWNSAPDLPVGGLFLHFEGLRNRLDEAARSGAIPVLAIALNTAGTTRQRLKCQLRAAAFPLPNWACAAGAVAGSA
jgi:hypothetical protein